MDFFGALIWHSQDSKASLVCTFSSVVIFVTLVTNFTPEQVTKPQRGSISVVLIFPPVALPQEWPRAYCIGDWVVSRAGLHGCGKYRAHRDSIPDPPARSEALYRLDYPGVHACHLITWVYHCKEVDQSNSISISNLFAFTCKGRIIEPTEQRCDVCQLFFY
jgi:hypothetical protein